MKLNFKELHLFDSIDHQKEIVVDYRKSFSDAIYKGGNGFEAHILCHKIFESNGDEEYTDREVELIQAYSVFGNPQFIDAVNAMIEKNRRNDTTSK